jgi:F-type H+-transporting ATPase subunit gamma
MVENIHVVLCTSDRGLCGGFNTNLVERAESVVKEKASEKGAFSFTCFGKKGRDWCRKTKRTIDSEHLGVVGAQFGFNVASTAGRRLVDGFLGEDFDEVYIVYAEFVSMARQVPMVKQLLPIPPLEEPEEEAAGDEPDQFMAEHICEPSPQELLDDMLPRNVYTQIYSALLETSTSEHAARMMAMDNATKACNDMLDNLTRVYNKARQAAITGELMDIVGGAEALRG